MASTRFSPLPATLTMASSRSSGLPSTVKSVTRMDRHQPLELMLDLLDHHRRPEVTMVMRLRCASCSVSDTVSDSIL